MIIKKQTKVRIGLIAGLVIVLTIIGVLFGFVWPLLPVQAGPTLPPRNRPAPDSPSDPGGGGDDDDDTPVGAYIELQVQPPQPKLWTVVQWQDSAGNWHNVDGWQGWLNANGSRRWWVSARDFGKGPFRWGVARGPDEPSLAVSNLFDLPTQASQVLLVEVLLAQ